MPVWIRRSARAAILREARRQPALETGGALFGYLAAEGVVVVRCGVAAGRSTRRAFRFVPDPYDLQRQIDRVIAESSGENYLVGEWHTHPSGAPHLSGTDTSSLRDIAHNHAVGIERPAAIVVAPTLVRRSRLGIGAFVWDPGVNKPKAQRVIVVD
ncbi:Mov34/MPN/PAD-1 family protein [Conexibacter sp. JD483]|uniref:Mov34/MPN/PAD-1 family protein n=1 Tax=unclassified Conexibacter TaxID=2627773 RepID=UPI002722A17A|nr:MULTISPECIES: Mov34/MPN/PAD-1 family protein [unclassified Conexibacter]MDO8185970.1 Mov34/MPN/PAD-1 family protein [Conexibacter sp. CPCC 205706]MDO8199461.1 Mov34/MPN/PAD-1 family protein [Conexibacter sp. CPCC 205762]MDR9368579.1 Mov34/MPN/PAD-1 family protein [Conexibacter sp. JD483]